MPNGVLFDPCVACHCDTPYEQCDRVQKYLKALLRAADN